MQVTRKAPGSDSGLVGHYIARVTVLLLSPKKINDGQLSQVIVSQTMKRLVERCNAYSSIGTVIPRQRHIRTQWLPLLIFLLVWEYNILLFRYSFGSNLKSLGTETFFLLCPWRF
ncbi:hypothetical protein TNCV_2886861 [Trichonephila clavipes]|nr:hypothetical protein TNCV_2886861 [Trichonephila clavipes]